MFCIYIILKQRCNVYQSSENNFKVLPHSNPKFNTKRENTNATTNSLLIHCVVSNISHTADQFFFYCTRALVAHSASCKIFVWRTCTTLRINLINTQLIVFFFPILKINLRGTGNCINFYLHMNLYSVLCLFYLFIEL